MLLDFRQTFICFFSPRQLCGGVVVWWCCFDFYIFYLLFSPAIECHADSAQGLVLCAHDILNMARTRCASAGTTLAAGIASGEPYVASTALTKVASMQAGRAQRKSTALRPGRTNAVIATREGRTLARPCDSDGSAKAARNEEGMKGQCTNTICWFKSRKVLIAGKTQKP